MTRKLMAVGVVVLGLALIWALSTWEPVDRVTMSEATEPAEPGPLPESLVQPATSVPGPGVARAPQPASPAPSHPTPVEPAQSPGPAEWPVPEMSGPVAELKHAFDTEPRESNAIAAESAIQTGFEGPAVHPALLESVLCHTTVCRVRMRWTKERALGFMAGLMHVITDPVEGVHFGQNMGIDQPSEPNPAGERTIDAYLKLQPVQTK